LGKERKRSPNTPRTCKGVFKGRGKEEKTGEAVYSKGEYWRLRKKEEEKENNQQEKMTGASDKDSEDCILSEQEPSKNLQGKGGVQD